jgi:uncharacterized protein with FMN-binding domain
MTSRSRTSVAQSSAPVGIAVALLATLSGCTTAVSTDTATDTDTDTDSQAEAAIPVDATFRDGVYLADGPYQSPNGAELIAVELTVESNVVTDVQITRTTTNPTTSRYQAQFASGIADVVVGQNLSDLDVTIVAGSSLTGIGFRVALDAIKADALDS